MLTFADDEPMLSDTETSVSLIAACRGDGKAYALVAIPQCDRSMFVGATVVGSGGTVYPAEVFPYLAEERADHANELSARFIEDDRVGARSWYCLARGASSARFVISFPLSSEGLWTLKFFCCDIEGRVLLIGERRLRAQALKWQSKLNYLLRKRMCSSIRDIDRRFNDVLPQISFTDVIEDAESVVVRARVSFPSDANRAYNYQAFDERGAVIERCANVMEDASFLTASGASRRVVTLSIRVPSGKRFATLQVVDEAGEVPPAFGTLDDLSYNGLLAMTRMRMSSASEDPKYPAWFSAHAGGGDIPDRVKSEALDPGIRIHLIVSVDKPRSDLFRRMCDSVLRQSCEQWDLVLTGDLSGISLPNDDRVRVAQHCEKADTGTFADMWRAVRSCSEGFVLFLGQEDELSSGAVRAFVRAASANTCADVLYCDEDAISVAGELGHPLFKPTYSPELLRACNYFGRALLVRASLLNDKEMFDGISEDAWRYDLSLRASERARSIVRIPGVLYHARVSSDPSISAGSVFDREWEAGARALESHLERCGIDARVSRAAVPGGYRLRYELGCHPKVSIVIPSKDKTDLLSACLESILAKCTYDNYEIVVVENNSVQVETFAYYDRVSQLGNVRVIKWEGAFNFSKIVNFGVSHTDAEYVLLLNNDTEVITPGFIEEMLGFFQNEGVGVVGAKLLFRDSTVQHGGVVLGPYASAGHLFASLPRNASGYCGRALLPQNLSAVTGACQLIPRKIFDEVGGYSEEYEVGLNDVDFCLKVRRAGYRIVQNPQAELFHYEFSSRGRDQSGAAIERAEKEIRLLRSRWPEYYEECDPYSNPCLDPQSAYFGLKGE